LTSIHSLKGRFLTEFSFGILVRKRLINQSVSDAMPHGQDTGPDYLVMAATVSLAYLRRFAGEHDDLTNLSHMPNRQSM
jgi:hypothetical protein